VEQRKKKFLLIFTKSQKNFVKISKKLGVMQKPATHRKSDFTVLSFFYEVEPVLRKGDATTITIVQESTIFYI
jgi:hypothetical protein